MVKSLKVEKVNGIATIEINKDELKSMVDAVEYMVDKQKRKLLENLPSNEGERKRLDNYNALKEDLKNVLKSLL
jgi:hypothetical protein